MIKGLLPILLSIVASHVTAQVAKDTTVPKALQEVIIKSWQRRDVTHGDEATLFAAPGRKSESINLAGTNANIAIKTGRQVFAKIPGVFVYDMDGSGNQINIATRGLDPHRSWEFNIRQNGALINSDMYGYPASHYSAPMESFEKIEVVRGTGALQYGAQFGGSINYTTKRGDSTKPLSFESINTVGSFGLVSSYNALGGTYKKWSYYAYYHRRHSDGYRKNSESDASAQFIQLAYQASPKLALKAELGRSKYLYHIPGPLSDSMFAADPRQSTRSRNYFSPDIYVPSLSAIWRRSEATTLQVMASGVFGTRSSVQFDAFADVKDSINPLTAQYKERQVDIDRFNSKTVEARLQHRWDLGRVQNRLAAGAVYMNNDLHRRQLGKGTTGSDYDLTLIEPDFGRDIHFKTENVALFAENTLQLSQRWTVTPGLRWEKGQSRMDGTIRYYTVNPLPTTIRHQFLLAGISTQYQLNAEASLYGGITQAYRPVIFKDIVPASTYEQIDKDLENATGYNAEAGARGKIGNRLQYDVSLFQVLYKARLGTVVLQDGAGSSYTYKTNVGDSRTNGVEVFVQYKFPMATQLFAGLFTSTSYMDAVYINGEVATSGVNKSIKGNKVEAVPQWITRNGMDILYKGFSATLLYSYTSSSFSDALNTIIPPASGARGFTPGYCVWDVNASLRTNGYFFFRAGINNIFNKQYFTKRPTFYPGPGIWPSDGRNAYITVGVRI